MLIFEAINHKTKYNNIKVFRTCVVENIIIVHNINYIVKYEFLYKNLVKKGILFINMQYDV